MTQFTPEQEPPMKTTRIAPAVQDRIVALRSTALSFALGAVEHGEPTTNTLARAEAYFGFLMRQGPDAG